MKYSHSDCLGVYTIITSHPALTGIIQHLKYYAFKFLLHIVPSSVNDIFLLRTIDAGCYANVYKTIRLRLLRCISYNVVVV